MQKDESIVFSKHALDQMIDRGADREEVALAILEGEKLPAKKGRWTFKKNFSLRTSGRTGTIQVSRFSLLLF